MLHLAILGTGMIAHEALEALTAVDSIKAEAIWNRPAGRAKAEALARQYDISKVFTNYQDLLADDGIDTIYIGLPNHVHFAYARRALEAGKNVILEKPSCPKFKELQDLCKLARDKELYLMEAVTFLHAPFFKKIETALPRLGNIKYVLCNYSKRSSRYDRYLRGDVAPAFDPKCAGGALMDLNIYNVNFTVALCGKPKASTYHALRGSNGIDTSGIALLEYNDMQASLTAAKDSSSPHFMTVQGENGWVSVTGSPNNLEQLEINIDGKAEVFDIRPKKHRMIDEFEDFAAMITCKDKAKMERFLQISLDAAATAEMLRQSAELGF